MDSFSALHKLQLEAPQIRDTGYPVLFRNLAHGTGFYRVKRGSGVVIGIFSSMMHALIQRGEFG